jgi:hypothetical protein
VGGTVTGAEIVDIINALGGVVFVLMVVYWVLFT